MKDSGKMTFSMDKEKKHGPIVLSMKVSITVERSTVLASIVGTMVQPTRVTGSRTKSVVLAHTSG